VSSPEHELPLASADTERYDYRFPTAEFDAWMREAERYVFDLDGRRELRRRFLTEKEIAEAEDYEAGPL
jgi:hypothetical protein